YPKENVCAFAASSFDLEHASDVTLKIGSDDGVAVWIDGKLVHQHPEHRGLRIDEDVVKAHLDAGTHAVLLKVVQEGGDWAFCVRLANGEGKPIDQSRQ